MTEPAVPVMSLWLMSGHIFNSWYSVSGAGDDAGQPTCSQHDKT